MSALPVEWVPCSERLPDVNVDVLFVVHEHGRTRVVFGSLGACRSDLTWYEAAGEIPDSWRAGQVTHWMPIPEPPR